MSTPNKQLLYEVVRRLNADEGEFIAQVEAAGFKLVKNYPALPRNYRFEAPADMEQWDAQWHLNEMPLVVDQGDKGDDKVATGSSTTAPLTTSVDLTRPLHEWQRNLRPSEVAKNGNQFKYSTRYGRQWGVGHICALTATAPFLTPKNESFPLELKRVGNGVDYYCLDSGVDDDHPEFDEGVYGYRAFFVVDGDDYYEVGTDDQNHGTGMSTCGAGNSIGIAVNSRVFWAKGLDGNNSGATSALIDAMNALVAAFSADTSGRPGVMNNSWTSTSSTAYTTTVDAAVDAGMVMVASAGNSNSVTLNYPAAYNDVISVGAMDIDRTRSSFSSFGSTVNVIAPGREILQGYRGGGINWNDGTSPAGGMTTGAVCALLQGYSRPSGRTDVLAVKEYVETVAIITDGATMPSGTTENIIFLGPFTSAEATRIPGLKNRVAPWANGIRSDSVSRAVSSPPGIGPSWTAKKHWREKDHVEPLHVGTPTPAGPSISPFQTRAQMQWGHWLLRNDGFNDIDVSGSADAGNLGFVQTLSSLNDADGTSIQIPNSPAPDDGNFAYLGPSAGGSNGRWDQWLPARMTPDSNPVNLFDVFDNLDYQDGTTTGWTTASGTLSLRTVASVATYFARYGTHYVEAIGDTVVTQTKTLPSSISTVKIDAGEMYFMFGVFLGTSFVGTPGDECRYQVTALDGSDVSLGDVFDTGTQAASTTGTIRWDVPGLFLDQVLLPVGTRKLRITKTWTLQAGSAVNCAVDGGFGWIFEKSSAGDRIADAISKGNAGIEMTAVHRSFNIDSDDQVRFVLGGYSFDDDLQGDLLVDKWYSTHNWTEIHSRIPLEPGTELIFVGVQEFLRAGTAVNAYWREMELKVYLADEQRREGSISRSFSAGVNPRVSTAGGQSGVVVSSGQ